MQKKNYSKLKKLKKIKLQLANPSLGKVDVKPHLGLREFPPSSYYFQVSFFFTPNNIDD